MTVPDAYPISAAELARQLQVNGKQLRDVLRAHPELVPGHVWHQPYQIDREMEREITRHPDVRRLPRLHG